MKTIITLLFGCMAWMATGQEKPVIITKEQVGNQIILTAENQTDKDYYFTLDVTSSGFNLSRTVPFNDIVEAGDKKLVLTLTALPNTRATYKYSLTPKPVEEEEEVIVGYEEKPRVYRTVVANSAKLHAERARQNVEKLIDPEIITIFTKDDCERCEYVMQYLEAFEIPHQAFNISTSLTYNELMWDALYIFGKKEGRITLPVITQNTEIHYSIVDLEGFVRDLVGGK